MPGSCQLPGDPASSFRHASPRSCVLTDLPTRRRPCGFSLLHGHVAMKLAWRAYVPSVGSRIRRSRFSCPGCHASTRFRECVRTWRRLDGPVARGVVRLLRPLCASAFGETDCRTLADGPTTRAPSLPVRPIVFRVIRQTRLFRVAFRYPCDRSAAWSDDAGLPSFIARRRSWGFKSPFAGLLPQTGGRLSPARLARRG
jgi:hypothetical protein